MKVLEPLRTYSSPSRRAVAFIDPNASDPEPGSVIAQAPTLSRVSRSSAQRSFCSMVPLLMIAADVRPIETPIAVTMPGEYRQISMMGIMVMAALPPSPPARSPFGAGSSSPAAMRFSRSMRAWNPALAIWSIPKVAKSFRRMSYGGRSPCSSSSRLGAISASTNWRTASRIISCSSDHSNISSPSDGTGTGSSAG